MSRHLEGSKYSSVHWMDDKREMLESKSFKTSDCIRGKKHIGAHMQPLPEGELTGGTCLPLLLPLAPGTCLLHDQRKMQDEFDGRQTPLPEHPDILSRLTPGRMLQRATRSHWEEGPYRQRSPGNLGWQVKQADTFILDQLFRLSSSFRGLQGCEGKAV